jgi:hypothetical protein
MIGSRFFYMRIPPVILDRKSKNTLTPFGLKIGDTLRYGLAGGASWEMTLLETSAAVLASDYAAYNYRDGGHESGDISAYGFSCVVRVNGHERELKREVGNQQAFYEPVCVDGVNVWLDAAACAFKAAGGFMFEKDIRSSYICKPDQAARFAVQEAGRSICPEPMRPWYPNSAGRLDSRQCYNGEDCWMGPYGGAAAHCGLDINMPAGTVLTAPLDLDDHYLFNTLAAGFNNNRWRGVRRWAGGVEWQLQAHHLVDMLVPERTALKAGAAYATTAGTAVGRHQHTHFMFKVSEHGGEYWLDPWILFWQIFRDGGR